MSEEEELNLDIKYGFNSLLQSEHELKLNSWWGVVLNY